MGFILFLFSLFYEVKEEKSQASSVLVWGNNMLTAQRKRFFFFYCDIVYLTVHEKIYTKLYLKKMVNMHWTASLVLNDSLSL